MSNLIEYIKESLDRVKYCEVFNRIPIYIDDPLTHHVDVKAAFKKIEGMLPSFLTKNIKCVIIGHNKEFSENYVNAMFKDGVLYVTNKQDNEEDLIDDVVHEVAHSIEEFAKKIIYEDKEIENEFIKKRNILYNMFKSRGIKAKESLFMNPKYSREFDMFLYKEVGYEKLRNLIIDVFFSPYAVTSLREYFAIGFEEYYLGDRKYLKRMSPELFDKIHLLDNYDTMGGQYV